MREYHVSLGNRIDVTSKPQCLEIVQKFIFKQWFAVRSLEFGKIGKLVRMEAEVLTVIDGITQAASDGVTAVERLLAKKQVEYRLMLQHGLFPVTIGHGQLVKVSQECGRNSFLLPHSRA